MAQTATPSTNNSGSARADKSKTETLSLSVDAGSLQSIEPVVGEKTDKPAFTRELLQVQWRDGDPIDLYVIRPHGVAKPPVVLYLYSYPSETDRFKDDRYCERVTRSGFAAIGFVSALTGHRYHDRPMREWFVSQMPEALTHSVHDIQMVLNYLAGRGDMDMTNVGMFGQGSGATIAILAASVEPRIRALNLVQPWGDWPTWIAKSSLIPEAERPNFLKPDFLAAIAPFDPVQVLPRLKLKPLRLQLVLNDSITPTPVVERIKTAAAPGTSVVQYQNERELYNASADGKIFDWLKQQLRASQPQVAAGAQPSHTGDQP